MKTYIKLWLTALFWGGAFVAGKYVSAHLESSAIAFLRFAIAGMLLLGLTWKQEGKLPRLNGRQMAIIIALGIIGIFAYNILFFKGLRLIEASRASLIIATCPAFVAFGSTILFREKIGPVRLAGIVLSVFGAVVVISKGQISELLNGGIGLGELFILGCVLSWVTYTLIGKTIMTVLSPLVAVSYAVAVGTVVLLIATGFNGLIDNIQRASILDWVAIFYMAVMATVLGFVWFYEGIKDIGVTRASLFINFVPVFAVLSAFLILDEPLTLSLGLGAALVLMGVFLTNRKRPALQTDAR